MRSRLKDMPSRLKDMKVAKLLSLSSVWMRPAAWMGAALIASTLGCTPPKDPIVPGGVPGVGDPMAVPQPGSGAVQYGVADKPVEGGKQMNSQAAAFYAQAMMAWANGDLKGAENLFSQSTQADPESYQTWYSLGTVQERLGKSSALQSYKKAYTVTPKYARAMVAYGLLLAKRGSLSEADSFLTKKRSGLPKSAGLAAALAEVKSLNKDSASAQDIAQEALKLDPSYSPAMMTIARDHYRNRRLDLSLYALKAVLDGFGADNPARDRDNAEAHLLRAFIWEEQELRPLAMGAFRKALDLRPDLVVARLKLATFLLESGGASEALPMLQTALRYDNTNIGARLGLGDAYRLTGQYVNAKKEFEWVRSKSGNMPQVHYNLGLLYLFAPKIPGMTDKAKVKSAIKSLEKFKELRTKTDRSDVDELLNQANLKLSEIEAIEKAKNPKPVSAPAKPAPAPK
jgi:Tfp pilus assembly protein PilF